MDSTEDLPSDLADTGWTWRSHSGFDMLRVRAECADADVDLLRTRLRQRFPEVTASLTVLSPKGYTLGTNPFQLRRWTTERLLALCDEGDGLLDNLVEILLHSNSDELPVIGEVQIFIRH